MNVKATDFLMPAPPWIGRFVAQYDATSTMLWGLRGAAAQANVFVGTIRGRRMRRRDDLFDQFGALLQFPHYFGGNWNAFVDCMRDLDWLRANGFLILILDAVEVLAEGDADEFHLLLRVLTETAQSWSRADEFRGPLPFHVILHATPAQSDDLTSKLGTLHVPVFELEP